MYEGVESKHTYKKVNVEWSIFISLSKTREQNPGLFPDTLERRGERDQYGADLVLLLGGPGGTEELRGATNNIIFLSRMINHWKLSTV